MKFFPHNTTGYVSYKDISDSPSSDTVHLCSFGGCALYQQVTSHLGNFKPRLGEAINLGHLGDGIYSVSTKSGVQRTKHMRLLKIVFAGTIYLPCDQQIEEFEQAQLTETKARRSLLESGYESDQTAEDNGPQAGASHQQEQLNYVPAQQSTIDQTDSEE